MPDHVRKQIRGYAETLLTGLTTTGDRVYVGRTRPLAEDHEPSLLIYTRRELSDVIAQGEPATLQRGVDLIIDGRVTASEPPDDTLDLIASEVEAALGADRTFGGLLHEITLAETNSDVLADGKKHIGLIQLRYRAVYWTEEDAPTVAV